MKRQKWEWKTLPKHCSAVVVVVDEDDRIPLLVLFVQVMTLLVRLVANDARRTQKQGKRQTVCRDGVVISSLRNGMVYYSVPPVSKIDIVEPQAEPLYKQMPLACLLV